MQLHPTRPAVHVALAGIAVMAVGVATRSPAVLAWGGALAMGIAVARAATLVSVARIRAAGFEMLWTGERRVERVFRGGTVVLAAELRNRDSLAARFVELRPVASSQLEVELSPRSGEVPAGGRLRVEVHVRAPRVGRHAVHGLALEVRGQPGLFEVPLTFANPFGVEVLPAPFAAMLRSARGGRGRLGPELGRPGRLPGEGSELRELRELLPGDAFKRIAWRASARRGKLMVREHERDERDVVWLLLDASIELGAGPLGRAPLDLAIDELSARAERHLSRGDRVGLAVVAARTRAWIPPEAGPTQASRIALALATAASNLDAERSDLDETDVALRVYEHLQSIDPRPGARLRRRDLDELALRADAVRAKGPFPGAPAPSGSTERERRLRRYMACFGMESPPRLEPDRPKTDLAMVRALERIAELRPRASVVHVVSPAPDEAEEPLAKAVRRLSRRGVRVEWVATRHERSIETSGAPWAAIVADAVAVRARVARERGERVLRRLGVRVSAPVAPKGAARRVEVP